MLRIILILLICPVLVFGQNITPQGATNQVNYQRGGNGADSAMTIPIFSDTAKANNYPNLRKEGRIIYTRTPKNFWYNDGAKWILSSSGSDNFANTDLNFTGNRTHTQGTNDLYIIRQNGDSIQALSSDGSYVGITSTNLSSQDNARVFGGFENDTAYAELRGSTNSDLSKNGVIHVDKNKVTLSVENATNSSLISIKPDSIIVTSNKNITTGLDNYATDISSQFTPLTKVTKEYVEGLIDTLTPSSLLTFNYIGGSETLAPLISVNPSGWDQHFRELGNTAYYHDTLWTLYSGYMGVDTGRQAYAGIAYYDTTSKVWVKGGPLGDGQLLTRHSEDPYFVSVGDTMIFVFFEDKETYPFRNTRLFTGSYFNSLVDQGVVLDIGDPGSWDGGDVSSPTVQIVNDSFYLYYEGRNLPTQNGAVGLARSAIGTINFVKDANNPIIKGTESGGTNPTWAKWLVPDDILTYQGRHYMTTHVQLANADYVVGVLVSADHVHWVDYLGSWPMKQDSTQETGGGLMWFYNGTEYECRYYNVGNTGIRKGYLRTQTDALNGSKTLTGNFTVTSTARDIFNNGNLFTKPAVQQDSVGQLTKINWVGGSYFTSGAFTGDIAFSHAPFSSNTMYRMTIKGFSSVTPGREFTLDLMFYYRNGVANFAQGYGAYLTSNGVPYFTQVRTGLDASGNFTILLGTTSTSWGSIQKVWIDDITALHTGYNNTNLQSGWTSTGVTDETGYTQLLSIPVTVGANQDWVAGAYQALSTALTSLLGLGTGIPSRTATGTFAARTITGSTNIAVTNGDGVSGNPTVAITGTIPATNGGTGQNSFTGGDMLYASSSVALSKIADVATGNALISGGVGNAPSYGKIGLTTHVSGILPVANGGTGLSVLGTANQQLRVNAGATALEYFTPQLTASATLDFLSTLAAQSSELTITVTGAADGDVVSLGIPNVSSNANSCYTARVSATNVVSVKFNNYSALPIDPASGVFKVTVFKY